MTPQPNLLISISPSARLWVKRLLFVLMAAVAVWPIVRLGNLIHVYSVNVPYWDDWSLVGFIRKSNAGTLTFGDFWAQHNEHLLVFPQMLMLGLAKLTRWNSVCVMYVSFGFAVAGFGLLASLLNRTFRSDRFLGLLALDLCAWLWFSPVQWENWLWGWQVQWFMSVFAVVLTIFALERWIAVAKAGWFCLAFVAAFLGTFSLGNGVFCWLVGLLYLTLAKPHRYSRRLWLAGALGTAWLFLAHYRNPPQQPDKLLFLKQPGKLLDYVERYMGRPLSAVPSEAAHFGTAVLVALCLAGIAFLVAKREKVSGTLPWLCLGTYAVIGAVTTGISRMGYGVSQALSSRYTTVAQLAVIAVIVILFELGRVWLKSTMARLLALEFCFLAATNFRANGEHDMRDFVSRHQQMDSVYAFAHQATSEKSDGLTAVYPQPWDVWPEIQYLRKLGWGGFDRDFPIPGKETGADEKKRKSQKASAGSLQPLRHTEQPRREQP